MVRPLTRDSRRKATGEGADDVNIELNNHVFRANSQSTSKVMNFRTYSDWVNGEVSNLEMSARAVCAVSLPPVPPPTCARRPTL